MKLYNTQHRRLERVRPRAGQPVGVYVCGITPYDTTHLGHAFTYVVFDVLIRHMETVHRWPVRYVQNLTDIDDDILARAREVGQDWRALGRRWTERFVEDMAWLNLRPPDRFPAATGYIDEMLAHTVALLEVGAAYERNGSVYYDVSRDPDFGAMARMSRDEMLATANERGNNPDDPNKDDPLDFVLWQEGTAGEPTWRSPWGAGRPGWNLECAVMARQLLGEQVDVHGGGADLCFPHHCCEIAECRPLVEVMPWVRVWSHTAMVHMDGEKMSKSLGNLVLVSELLNDVHPDTVRLYLLRHHYRDAWEWDPERLEETRAWTRTLLAAVARSPGTGHVLDPASYGPRFSEALDDDLDTPRALEVVMKLADDILAAPAGANIAAARDVLRALAGSVLGLWLRPRNDIAAEERPTWPAPETGEPDGTYPLQG